MKLRPREQGAIGILAIGVVLFFGWFGVIGTFGLEPQIKELTLTMSELNKAKSTEQLNQATLNNLKQQKASLSVQQVQMPEGKKIGEIDHAKGQTLEMAKRELLNDVIEMGQNSFDNTLIYVKPLPPPEPTPEEVAAIAAAASAAAQAPVPATPGQPPAAAPVPGQPPIPGQLPIPGAPPEPKLSDFVEEIPYEIAMRGSYRSINDFINQLATYKTVVDIQQLTITTEAQGGTIPIEPDKPLKAVFKITYLIRK